MSIPTQIRMAADELGIRLEMVQGVPVWEAQPAYRHQRTVFRIESSIRRADDESNGCGCIHVADLSIRFPDGSQKRPDISIFCREPDEQESEVTLVPSAVIAIISKGYEAKDRVIGVPFYLSQGVQDIVVFDPYTGEVTHTRPDGETTYASPVDLTFACGCACTV
jgi:Uma2 family endonuclease